MSATKNETRCYECGCCDSVDGWCDLVGTYGFEVDDCNIPETEKHSKSSWYDKGGR